VPEVCTTGSIGKPDSLQPCEWSCKKSRRREGGGASRTPRNTVDKSLSLVFNVGKKKKAGVSMERIADCSDLQIVERKEGVEHSTRVAEGRESRKKGRLRQHSVQRATKSQGEKSFRSQSSALKNVLQNTKKDVKNGVPP